ncbi:Imm7 family immunity protein [Roseovarius rhodophyticola]|uniref:Imm7 family immunity protein n=1 Tax=Roseovarius rhodophyticola TaxID=3080827 RepID=A0ABZ2TMX5_9RHOB|nr:Imm7 family immunity protein [Roseovarius sp. W115]MDV2929803.1 Imm7 family immunity protein [Roseovarius sp. W115]
MVELHGWFTIREAFREEDESDEVLSSAIFQIEKAISKLSNFNLAAKLMQQNGCYSLLINGNFNHRDSRWTEVTELVQLVSKIAPGSYGILHFHDDEDKNGRENQFQALVMKKGRVQTLIDENLSPFFCDLEDASDPS